MRPSCITSGPTCGLGMTEDECHGAGGVWDILEGVCVMPEPTPAPAPAPAEPAPMGPEELAVAVARYTEVDDNGIRTFRPEYAELIRFTFKYYKSYPTAPLDLADETGAVQITNLEPMTQEEMAEVDAGSDVGKQLEVNNAENWVKMRRMRGRQIVATVGVVDPSTGQRRALFACKDKHVPAVISELRDTGAVVPANGVLGKLAGVGVVGLGLIAFVGITLFYGFKTRKKSRKLI